MENSSSTSCLRADISRLLFVVISMPGVATVAQALASFLLGMSFIVRNNGLFKGLAYISYRKYKNEMKRKKKNKAIPVDKKEDDYITFITNKYAVKWKAAPHFVFGGIYAVLFVLFLFIGN